MGWKMTPPPDDARCEAMAKGVPGSSRYPQSHRCVRKANQMRGLRQVCPWHAALHVVRWWCDEPLIEAGERQQP